MTLKVQIYAGNPYKAILTSHFDGYFRSASLYTALLMSLSAMWSHKKEKPQEYLSSSFSHYNTITSGF